MTNQKVKVNHFFLENKISGCSSNIKIKKIKKIDNNTLIISSPESVCWLLNIRGYDLPNTPFGTIKTNN